MPWRARASAPDGPLPGFDAPRQSAPERMSLIMPPAHGRKFVRPCGMDRLMNLLEPAILLRLADGHPRHGYELAKELGGTPLLDAEVGPTAVYRAIRALEANGMVETHWATSDRGPRRKCHQITETGTNHLLEWAGALEVLADSAGRLAARAEGLGRES
ncbi:MAG: hypothetical protein GF320_15165 [Armatimonadia bacterium]|nr:hypothetical protein [Armatimonadia bacterium]